MATKILQCGYMSGDTYTASVLLAADRTVSVVLVKDTKGVAPYADKSGFILNIYAESGMKDRVHLIDISASKVRITDLWKEVQGNFKDSKPAPSAARCRRAGCHQAAAMPRRRAAQPVAALDHGRHRPAGEPVVGPPRPRRWRVPGAAARCRPI